MIKKTFILISFLLLLFVGFSTINVNAELIKNFNAVYDPDIAYTNDNNAMDNDILTYAYTTSWTNDHWLELTHNSNDAILTNKIYVSLGWYKSLTTYSAQYVDIQIYYTNLEGQSGFTWHTLVTDGTYPYMGFNAINLNEIIYLNGVRVRSYDSTHTYTFRVFEVWTALYETGDGRYAPTTTYFDWTEQKWFNVTDGNSYADCSVNVSYDFSAFSHSTPSTTFTGENSIHVSCNSTSLTVYNNTQHTTGYYQTAYDSSTGWKIWLNYTGAIPTLTKYENIVNATGNHDSIWSTSLWKYTVWANYTGTTTPIHLNDIKTNCIGTLSYILNNTGYWITSNHASYLNKYENIINATGTHNSGFNSNTGYWNVWANYTGNTTPIHLNEVIVNATGTHEYILKNDGYYIWANYTGNSTGGGEGCGNLNGIYYINYSDDNITFNATIDYHYNESNCGINLNNNVNGAVVNDDNWFNLAGSILFDNSQLFLFILLSLWIFFITKCIDNKGTKTHLMFAFVQFAFSIPLAIVIAVISLSFMFGFIVVFFIPIFALYLLADCLIYRN